MKDHLSHEQIAAVASGDGEAPWAAHVSSCAACAEGVRAVEQTVVALHALADPEPRAEDMRAWRAAVAQRRGRQGRAYRAIGAISGAAALIVAFAVFTNGSSTSNDTAGAPSAEGGPQLHGAALTEEALRARLVALRDVTAVGGGESFDSQAESDAQSKGAARALSTARDTAPGGMNYRRCDRAVWEGKAHPDPLVYSGSWQGSPAWVLVYALRDADPPRAEAWVLSQTDCEVLQYVQERL